MGKADGLMRRWQEQRWILDQVIRTVGAEWDQPRLAYMAAPAGLEAMAEFRGVGERIRKAADIDREFARAAERREARAAAYEAEGRHVSARESYLIAALLWASARWPIFEVNDTLVRYEERMNACYGKFAAAAPHPVERAEIPFGDKSLPAYLHLPRKPQPNERFPCVINIPGMDSCKENGVAQYGDPLLERGLAVLSVDGPGQGECCTTGVLVTESNHMDAALAEMAWIERHPHLDPERVAIKGTSFGSYYGIQQAAALGERAKALAVTALNHEPGCNTIFNMASPSFKLRYMFMSGYEDEAAFDAYAAKYDVRPMARDLKCPYLAVGGDADELSPAEHTRAVFELVPTPKRLVLYEGANHAVSDGMAVRLGENRNTLIADWLAERFAGKPMTSESVFVDSAGRAHATPAG